MGPQARLSLEPLKLDDPFIVEIKRVSDQIAAVARDVTILRQELARRRREIKDGIKRHDVAALATLGGRCPCCWSRDVVADGKKTAAGEFDHFYSASKPDIEHTWLICKPCHSDLTAGRIARDEREAEFRAYQNRRRRMTGRPLVLL
jgi:hypothetical protein